MARSRRLWTRVRSDASSTQIEASGAYTASPTWKWSDTVDVKNFTHLAVFFNPVTIVTVTVVVIVIAWSDDGATIPFDDDDNFQRTDYNIANFTDGAFNPKIYRVVLTTDGGELVAGQLHHFVYPVKGGVARVGVRADTTGGSYTLRSQRLVR